jgi:hypothetical protein
MKDVIAPGVYLVNGVYGLHSSANVLVAVGR